MLPKTTKSVNIEFDVKVITQQTAAKIVATLVEFLAYHRKQIPFPFSTFEMMVNNISAKDPKQENSENWSNNFQADRQKLLAQRTLKDLTTLRKVCRVVLFFE